MKILYVTSGSGWGGASSALYNLIVELKHKGHEIRVLFPDSNGLFESKLRILGIKCYHSKYDLTIRQNTRNWLKNIVKTIIVRFELIITELKISRIIKEYKPDIVHTNVGPLDVSLDICQKNNIPHVWHLREYQNLDFNIEYYKGIDAFKKRIKENGNYNIAITNGVFNHWNLRENRDIVIYDGVISTEEHSDILKKTDLCDPYFLFVGRLDDAKNPIEAIKAFILISNKFPKIKLLLAGSSIDSFYLSKCKQLVASNNLEKRIVFLGQRNDIFSLMSKSVALLVTSRFEGFGFITAEAMFNKCLVIGKNTAGTKEQFDNGLKMYNREIALRYMTVEDLSECMILALENDYSEMKRVAFSAIVDNYLSSVHSKNVEEYYYRILKHKSYGS